MKIHFVSLNKKEKMRSKLSWKAQTLLMKLQKPKSTVLHLWKE